MDLLKMANVTTALGFLPAEKDEKNDPRGI